MFQGLEKPGENEKGWEKKKKSRSSEGERFSCDFEAFLDKEDPPDRFSECLPASQRAGMVWVGRDYVVLDPSD